MDGEQTPKENKMDNADFLALINNLPQLNWKTGDRVKDDEGNIYTFLDMKPMWIAEEQRTEEERNDPNWDCGSWGYELTLIDSDGQEVVEERNIYTVHHEWTIN